MTARTSRIAFALMLASYLLPGITPSSFPSKEVRTDPGQFMAPAREPRVSTSGTDQPVPGVAA
jgi:hypothetical protein